MPCGITPELRGATRQQEEPGDSGKTETEARAVSEVRRCACFRAPSSSRAVRLREPQGTTPPGSLPRCVFCKEHLLRSHQSHLATYCSQFPFSSRSNTRSSPLQGLQKQTDRKPTWGGVGLSAESGLLPAQSVRRCLPK